MLIDTHAHLYDVTFDCDRREVMERAGRAGVGEIILPAIDSEYHDRLLDMCRAYPQVCRPLMGLHPTSVNGNPCYREELGLVERMLNDPPVGIGRFYGIGEIGLDLYWSRESIAEQTEAFVRQLELSVEHKLPVVVHVREAWNEVLDVLEGFKGCGLRGIMHAYSGGYEESLKVGECGDFLFGVGGVVTYKNNRNLVDFLKTVSPERIVLETDCPYLTPVPFRGKRNESSYLTYIRDAVAAIYGMPAEEIETITTRNAQRVFGEAG